MQPFVRTEIGKPEQWLIEAGAAIGLNFSVFIHETTNQFRDHVLNRHGDPAIHGTATVINEDFSRIPSIIQKPDMAIIGVKRKGATYIVYVKTESNVTYLYFEQILNSRRNKALRGSTFYKVTRPLLLNEVLKNISRNDKTDLKEAKIFTRGKS
ncbi:hypothetical protein LQZ21_14320 [Treponema sp. TIM-1]|uniref:PBECR3 domain-containing polyvalent protein n=1 Tax=Treponema sp. TIM-1 TaxID=2898417 RepID=UPI00397F548D